MRSPTTLSVEKADLRMLLLHLSDLHFGERSRFYADDQGRAARAFASATQDAYQVIAPPGRGAVPVVDAVVVSGDVAESGREQEFDRARGFLLQFATALDLKPRRFVFAPGNHDVSWLLSRHALELSQERGGGDEAAIRRAMDNAKLARFEAFLVKFYGIRDMAHLENCHALSSAAWLHYFPDLGLSVAALNSCERESHRPQDHLGQIGSAQAQALMDAWAPAGAWIKVMLFHHNLTPASHQNHEHWKQRFGERGYSPDLLDCYAADMVGLDGHEHVKCVVRDRWPQLVLHGHQHVDESAVWDWSERGVAPVLGAGRFGPETDGNRGEPCSARLIYLDVDGAKESRSIRIEFRDSAREKGQIEKGAFTVSDSRTIPLFPPPVARKQLCIPPRVRSEEQTAVPAAISPLTADLFQAKEHVIISGHTLDKFSAEDVHAILLQLLNRGVRVTLVLLNPKCAYAAAHAPFHHMETTGHGDSQQQIENFLQSVQGLCHLAAGRNLEVFVSSYMPRFRTVLIDDERCRVSLYMYGTDVLRAPEMVFGKGDAGPSRLWFQTIRHSIQTLLASSDVIRIVQGAEFDPHWESVSVREPLLRCTSKKCCRSESAWDEVTRHLLACQNGDPQLAFREEVCAPDYEPGTYVLSDISGSARFLSEAISFDAWIDRVLDDDLRIIEERCPGVFERLPKAQKAQLKQRVIDTVNFIPLCKTTTDDTPSLKSLVWVQEYSDVLRRILMTLLFGTPDHELDLYPELTHQPSKLILDVIEQLERMDLTDRDWLRLSIAAGLLGVERKSPHAATSAIYAVCSIDLARNGESDDTAAERIARELLGASRTTCGVDASAAFLFTLGLRHHPRTHLVSFPDDYLETMVLLKFYERLLKHHTGLRITCVPRAIRCSNDATWRDVRQLSQRFEGLRDPQRFQVSPDGPKTGGVNLTKLHPNVLRLIRQATLVDVRGARSYEMMQGIEAETYFGFVVCRDISEGVTGYTSSDLPLVYIRHTAGDRSFRGFKERRPDGTRPMQARVTVQDQPERWAGGHLAASEGWSAERKERYRINHAFYTSNAIDFDRRFGGLLEREVTDHLNRFIGKVLVLACGSGKEVDYLVQRGCDAIGVDLSRDAIQVARKRHAVRRFWVGDFYDLDTLLMDRTRTFDGIVANAAFVHVLHRDDFGSLLEKIHRRLVPGGRVFLRMLDKNGVREEIDTHLFSLPRWFVYFDENEIASCAREAGFQVASLAAFPHDRYPKVVRWVSAMLTT
jgi:SAM-dependent methyltransferase/3',5'-cyclic AMP phosphodiesterase CpdA